jgi:hypothetical protein
VGAIVLPILDSFSSSHNTAGRVTFFSSRAAAPAPVVALALLVAAPAASPWAARDRGPWLLTSLPSIGTITWRCAAGARPTPRAYALGFRAFASSATDEVRFVIDGRTVVSRTVQPSESLSFPHLAAPLQQVVVKQGTEPRTLHATVTVNFKSQRGLSYCWPYLPPPIAVHVVYARR